MAIIGFKIHGATYFTDSNDACNASTDGTSRYFDDQGGALAEPGIGSEIFLDAGGEQLDSFEADGETPKVSGTPYWYHTEFNKSIQVDENGVVVDENTCSSDATGGIGLGPKSSDVQSACLNNVLDSTKYNSAITPGTLAPGDVLYDDLGETILFDGQNAWYYLYDENKSIQVGSNGKVNAIQSCSVSSFSIDISNPNVAASGACSDIFHGTIFSPQGVGSLVVGSFVFKDPGLLVPFDGQNYWYLLIGQGKAIQVDPAGKIIGIEVCGSGPSYTVFSFVIPYAAYSSEDICDSDEWGSRRIYYPATEPKTLLQIAQQGIPIFVSTIGAQTWINETGAGIPYSWIDAFPEFYAYTLTGTGKEWYVVWNISNSYTWLDGGDEFRCSIIEYEIFPITLEHTEEFDTEADNFCTGCKIKTNFYYKAAVGSNLNLLEIAQQNILIYTTITGAENALSSDLAPLSIYSSLEAPGLGWFLYGNSNPSGRKWLGFDLTDNFIGSLLIEKGGNCDIYVRPGALTSELISSTEPFASKYFYAFWSCSADEVSPGDVKFPVYLIDGDHFYGESNYMTEFYDAMTTSGKYTFTNTPGDECMTFIHRIVAIDINEAQSLLENLLPTGYDPVQQKPANFIGIFSGNTLNLKSNCGDCICEPIGDPYTFGDIESQPPLDLGPNFSTEKNYNLDNVARPLLRTNPKLTANVKIIADNNDRIFLESIDATKDLASIEYKRNEVNKSGKYSYDVANFFNSKRTPSDIIYKTKRASSDISVLESYQSQIEESYQYGATINYSKLYDEKFRIFAPIWADLNMPKKFVIFKVNNPANAEGLLNNAEDNFSRIKSMLANAEIVKTFDLTKNSAIGQYIRNHVQDERFPASPLTFSFEKNEKSSYNGIDLSRGGFTSKSEYLYKDFVEKDKPLIEANDFITDGFRRNSMVSANILNLEFLFNDVTSTDYSVNRYFGLYVDDIDSGLGEVLTSNFGRIKFKSLDSYVNPNIQSSAIPSYKMMNGTLTLGYTAIEGDYYKISNNKYYEESNLNLEVVDVMDDITKNLGIKYKGKSIDIEANSNEGFDFIKFKIAETPVINDNIAIVNTKEEAFSFKFIKHIPITNVTVEDSHGHSFGFGTGNNVAEAIANFETAFATSTLKPHFYISKDADKIYLTEKMAALGDLSLSVTIPNGNLIKVSKIYTHVNLYDNTLFAAGPGELTKGTFSGNRFSQDGKLSDIAIAISAAISNMPGFSAFSKGEDVYVSVNIPGYNLRQHTLLVKKANNTDFIKVGNTDVTGSILKLDSSVLTTWNAHYFNGGNTKGKSILVNGNTISEIEIGDYIGTKYNNVYNKIIDVVEYIDDLESGMYKVILNDINTIKTGECRLYRENKLRIGLFSAYDIYDLNFDFYDTSNSDLKELKKEELDNIVYPPYIDIKGWTDPDDINYRPQYTGLTKDEVLDSDYALSPIDYFSNLLPLLSNETIDGTAGEFINSEFDRLQENNTKEFALNSRVVPNINKWVLKNTLTTREQPYYLNANEAFGRTNFAPDLSVEGRDRKSFTHEWFYMDKLPTYYRYNDINDTFSYINFIQDFELTKELFMDPDNDYFDKFMVYEGLEVKTDSSKLLDPDYPDVDLDPGDFDMETFSKSVRLKKYSPIESGSNSSFASTFFKGIKVLFKSRKEFNNDTATEFVKNTEFNGYRFSTVVKVNNAASEDVSNSIEYDVIQNKAHKFVIFFITLNISDYWLDGSLSRKMLYELNHKLVYSNAIRRFDAMGEYIYSDVNLYGALDLLNADFTGSGPYSVTGITHADGTDSIFTNQIATGTDGIYGRILMDFGTGITYAARVQSVNSSNELTLFEIPYDIDFPVTLLPTSYLSTSLQENASYKYEGGGINAHSTILELLSIQNVADLLNSSDSDVNYKTIEADGTILDNRFVINFESGKEIIKRANLTIEEDTNKPKSYKLSSGTIGYNIVEGQEYYPFLIRHSGNYTVDMKPVVTFTDLYSHFKVNRDHLTGNTAERIFEESLYKHSLSSISEYSIARDYYNRFNRCGTTFNLGFIQDNGDHDKNWGLIKNHFYHKVNDINTTGVTKLTASSELLPLYPLIGEVAVDKKDINVFRSSWDSNYYTRSLAGGKSEKVSGTFDVIEERSYLASTIMKVENSYILLDYTYSNVESKETLDDILRNSNNTSDIMIFEDEDTIVADFFMDSIIYKKLRDSGVLNTLQTNVDPTKSIGDKTTLVDDSEAYIINNLLDVFTVDYLKLYTKPFKGSSSIIINSDSVDSLASGGFESDSNFTYTPHAETPLNFRMIYNKRLGYSYEIKPIIKIKS